MVLLIGVHSHGGGGSGHSHSHGHGHDHTTEPHAFVLPSLSIVGGMSIEKQRRLLGRQPDIVVGTPGRLWELASDGFTPHLSSLHEVRFFVLDEVDRMVDAGHFKELAFKIDKETMGVKEKVRSLKIAPKSNAPAASASAIELPRGMSASGSLMSLVDPSVMKPPIR